MSRLIIATIISVCFLVGASTVSADVIKINSSGWLGNLKLESNQLIEIKKAMEKALDAPIDAAQQCGEERMDCEVRAAREWTVGKDRFRELVVHIHAVGQASNVVGQANGVWPTISAK